MNDAHLLTSLVFITAVLYSAVGHAGASGYLAAMAMLNVPPDVMKPTALFLNIVVASIATIRFANAGCFSWRVFSPFAVSSVPAAAVGGWLHLPASYYKTTVACILLFASLRLIWTTARGNERAVGSPPPWLAFMCGGAIGLLAGLTGTGGGIFLSPLLLLLGWASTRECAGVSAAFVLLNSIAGLAGNYLSVERLPTQVGALTAAAVVGGLIGSELGTRRLAPSAMRYVLGFVLIVAACKMLLA